MKQVKRIPRLSIDVVQSLTNVFKGIQSRAVHKGPGSTAAMSETETPLFR